MDRDRCINCGSQSPLLGNRCSACSPCWCCMECTDKAGRYAVIVWASHPEIRDGEPWRAFVRPDHMPRYVLNRMRGEK